MEIFDYSNTQGSMQDFLPLQQLYDKNMAFATTHRKTLEDGVPEDPEPRQTRLRKKRYADWVERFDEMKQRTLPKVDAFIAALPGMLADAEKQNLGPDEVWKLKGFYNCCCVEKSGSCSGHIFDMDQYFLAWSDYQTGTGSLTPYSPGSPGSPA